MKINVICTVLTDGVVNGSSDIMREDTAGVVTRSADLIVAACIVGMRADTDGVLQDQQMVLHEMSREPLQNA